MTHPLVDQLRSPAPSAAGAARVPSHGSAVSPLTASAGSSATSAGRQLLLRHGHRAEPLPVLNTRRQRAPAHPAPRRSRGVKTATTPRPLPRPAHERGPSPARWAARGPPPRRGRRPRVTYHYWIHIGEILAIPSSSSIRGFPDSGRHRRARAVYRPPDKPHPASAGGNPGHRATLGMGSRPPLARWPERRQA